MEYDPSCDFCQIARGEAEAEMICESDTWVAFFPLNPATPGHTLIVPRIHQENLWDIEEALADDLMHAVIRVGRAVEVALSPDGMNMITSAGRTAEQSVFHTHLHIVPRWERDGFGEIWPAGLRYDVDGLDDVADKIRHQC